MTKFKIGDYIVSNDNFHMMFFDCTRVYKVVKCININNIDAVLLDTLDIFYCSAKYFRYATDKEIIQGYRDE